MLLIRSNDRLITLCYGVKNSTLSSACSWLKPEEGGVGIEYLFPTINFDFFLGNGLIAGFFF